MSWIASIRPIRIDQRGKSLYQYKGACEWKGEVDLLSVYWLVVEIEVIKTLIDDQTKQSESREAENNISI